MVTFLDQKDRSFERGVKEAIINKHYWTEVVAYDASDQPPTMEFLDLFPGASTPTHIVQERTSIE